MSEDVTGMPIRAVTETERATALQMAAEAEAAIRGGWVPKTICSSSVERHNRANAERFFAEASSRSKRAWVNSQKSGSRRRPAIQKGPTE